MLSFNFKNKGKHVLKKDIIGATWKYVQSWSTKHNPPNCHNLGFDAIWNLYIQNNDSNISWIKTIFVIVYGLEYISFIFGKRRWKERGKGMEREGERWQSDGSTLPYVA